MIANYLQYDRKKCEEERKRKEQQLDFVLKESEAIKHYFKKKIESVGSNVEELGRTLLSLFDYYSKTQIYRAQIYRKPRFTAANFFPQIGLTKHILNKQNPDLPRTPIYRGCFLSQNPR